MSFNSNFNNNYTNNDKNTDEPGGAAHGKTSRVAREFLLKNGRKPVISTYTLGCKVNQCETEAIEADFLQAGYDLSGSPADIYIINTCTVTNLADRKSRQHIRKMKQQNPEAFVIVTGCYAQVSPEEADAIEGVNLVLGTDEKTEVRKYAEKILWEKMLQDDNPEVPAVISSVETLTNYREPAFNRFARDKAALVLKQNAGRNRSRAFVKIQEGCNRFCSYCIIPYARGPVRSREPEAVLEEVRALVESGFKEIVLTGINTALYGVDFAGEKTDLTHLLEAIENLSGEFRIRFSSLEPTVVNAEFVKGLLKYKRLCHHLHLSVQSGSNKVIGKMNRHYTREEYLDIIEVLRGADPCYGITTDIIAGFPGETEEDFLESLKIVEEAGYTRIHVFPYSKRKGTPAAAEEDQISPEIKKLRAAELIKAGAKAEINFNRSCIGTVRQAFLEEYDLKTNCYVGYLDNYVRVYLPAGASGASGAAFEGERLLGQLVKVGITDLYLDGVKVKEERNVRLHIL